MSNVYPVIKLNPNDDVVIARHPVAAGTFLAQESVTVRSDIPEGHKVSLRDLSRRAGKTLWANNWFCNDRYSRRGPHSYSQYGHGGFHSRLCFR